jgi:hypothetical protein
MVVRSPLVVINGRYSELPPNDSVAGVNLNQITSSSGISGSGDLALGSVTVNVSLPPNPSGLYVVSDYIGVDGSALVSGTAALSLANTASVSGQSALSSITATQALANRALASGNAALSNTAGFSTANSVTLIANSDIVAFTPVGMNTNGGVETVRDIGGTIYPQYNGYQTFLGVASKTVSSGQSVSVLLPKSLITNFSGLTPGAFYYVSPATSGFVTSSSAPGAWYSRATWQPVARAVSSSGLLLLKPL